MKGVIIRYMIGSGIGVLSIGVALTASVGLTQPNPKDLADWAHTPSDALAIQPGPGMTLSNGVLRVTTSNVVNGPGWAIGVPDYLRSGFSNRSQLKDWVVAPSGGLTNDPSIPPEPRLKFRLESLDPAQAKSKLPDEPKASEWSVVAWITSDYGGHLYVEGVFPKAQVLVGSAREKWLKAYVEQHFLETGGFPTNVGVAYVPHGTVSKVVGTGRNRRLQTEWASWGEPQTPVSQWPAGSPVDGSRVKVSRQETVPCQCHGVGHPVMVTREFYRKHGHWMEVLP